MDKADIKSMSLLELTDLMGRFDAPAFRASQIFDWLHAKQVDSFSQMHNLPKVLIERLEETCALRTVTIEKKLTSRLDETVKYLFSLSDGERIESVLMRYKHGLSLCVSTQVGCQMGCSFCASTKAGLVRNLTPSEILSQIYQASADAGERISHVVLMGIGEPLDNFSSLVRFLDIIGSEKGYNLSMRHVSVSTCGLADKIYELAELELGITLSVSLHAPWDSLREQMMPVNRRYPIAKLLEACRDYTGKTSRRISFEYAMIRGVNDTDEALEALAGLLKGMLCHVNLIAVNSIQETDYQKSTGSRIETFCTRLNSKGINTTVRRTLGSDILAACGQLRRESAE